MVRGLTILNSSINGSRDLWWPHDRTRPRIPGFNVYRAYDAPVNWVKLNAQPITATYFRDQTTLDIVNFTVTNSAWVDKGEMGMKCVKLPDVPYTEVVKGRPTVATNPNDVLVIITDAEGTVSQHRPKMVVGIDQEVFLPVGKSLPVGGAVSEFSIIDFDTVTEIVIVYRKLVNYVDIQTNMLRSFYCVVPVGLAGEEHAPGVPGCEIVDSLQVDRMDYMQARMVHCNAWIFEQNGEPAHLLLRRVAGQPCGCSSEFTKGRSGCPTCFETGIVGGYYGPFDFLFQDPDVGATRTIEEGGTKVERMSRSYLGRSPIVQDGDLIIRRNGERLVISNVTYKTPRGVLLQQEFDVTLLSPGDTRYLIPLPEANPPLIYNPASQPNPGPGSEPVFQIDTVPGKHLEYPTAKPGRTVAFGRIQT